MLTGKRVLVTAATNAVGRAVVLRLVTDGATVAVPYSSRAEKADVDLLLAQIRRRGRAAYAFAGTGAGSSVAPDLLAAVTAELGRLDVLVINGADDGASPPGRVQDPDAMSVIRWVRQAGELMAGSGGGVIVHVHVPKAAAAPTAPTAASRTGQLSGDLGTAARELAEHQVRVVGVHAAAIAFQPGAVHQQDDHRSAADNSPVPLRRLGSPEDVAGAVAWLSSDDANYITGTALVVDGGVSLNPRLP